VVVAIGTVPAIPPIPGLSDVPFWTNHEVIEATELPGSLTVLGGGAIGLEIAQSLSRFGVRTTVIEALPRLLPLEEPEVGEELARVLEREGIYVRVATRAVHAERDGERIAVHLEGGGRVVADRLLVATGRRAQLASLGLETVGIDAGQGHISTDEHMRAVDGVWAVGDVTGLGAFTHVAMYQSAIVVADILGEDAPGADYRAVPRVTFTDPEAASVGLTEEAARRRGIAVRTGSARVAHSARGWIHGPGNDGFIKLVEDADRGVLVGATSVGPRGGEVLSMLTLAVHAEVPSDALRHMVYAYPTFHRGVEDALRALASG
jgi:pyruvate/2-oxoglutarate dehydrogenase complex dihydrolipoamide dehydrogenase (E3) component